MSAYVADWEAKCYFEGIPDEVPAKLLFSGRAPSWKAIAICILSNDLKFKRLGMRRDENKTGLLIEALANGRTINEVQLDLWEDII